MRTWKLRQLGYDGLSLEEAPEPEPGRAAAVHADVRAGHERIVLVEQEDDGLDNVWVALWNGGKLGRFDTAVNQWVEYTPPTQPANFRRGPGADSQNNIWVGIWAAGKRPAKLAKLYEEKGWTPAPSLDARDEPNHMQMRRMFDHEIDPTATQPPSAPTPPNASAEPGTPTPATPTPPAAIPPPRLRAGPCPPG